MPVVFREGGYRFHFYSDEGDPREPVHVHVKKGRDKFWLRPDITVAYNHGFSSREQSELVRLIASRRDEIERAWNDHFA